MTARPRPAWLLMAVLTGCTTVGPVHEVPDSGLTEADRFVAAPAVAPQPTEADLRWWRRFDDPELGAWVDRALAANLDIAVARERVAQAQALLGRARGQRRPAFDAQARVDVQQRRGTDERAVQPGLSLSMGWDLDLWGGLRQAERSAAAGVMRSQDLVQAARLSTAGATARAYVAWREAQADRQWLAQALALQQDVSRIVRVRVDDAGLAPRLDLDRALAQAAATEADAAEAASREAQALAALHVLAGQRPGAPDAHLPVPDPMTLPALDGPQPVARPLDLLRLRPDLRAAERALAGAVADIGVAQSALYPRLQLPGLLTLTSAGLGGGVLDIVSASVAAVLDLSMLDGGQRGAEVDAARSRAREAALVYRQTLLEALRQAETALMATEGSAQRILALQRADASASAAVAQARTLYTAGLIGFLEVLDAQRSALDQQRELVRARADAARSAIASFEAMGLIAGTEATGG